jgi:DNA-binding LytR/AlgR family response regulator
LVALTYFGLRPRQMVTGIWSEMETLRFVIVEDDLSFALELEMLLDELGYTIAGKSDHAETALALILREKPDIVLMDIELKGKLSGVEIGEILAPLGIPVLYITSLRDEHYQKARLQQGMIGYLVKPVDEITLRSAIEMAVRTRAGGAPSLDSAAEESVAPLIDDYFFIRDKKRLVKVQAKDICWIRADGPYACLASKDKEFLISTHLGALEEKLHSLSFARVHRSWLVNCTHIQTIEEDVLTVCGQRIPVGKSYRESFYRLLRQL